MLLRGLCPLKSARHAGAVFAGLGRPVLLLHARPPSRSPQSGSAVRQACDRDMPWSRSLPVKTLPSGQPHQNTPYSPISRRVFRRKAVSRRTSEVLPEKPVPALTQEASLQSHFQSICNYDGYLPRTYWKHAQQLTHCSRPLSRRPHDQTQPRRRLCGIGIDTFGQGDIQHDPDHALQAQFHEPDCSIALCIDRGRCVGSPALAAG